jgi:hypothetical protein
MGCDGGLVWEALHPENAAEDSARRHPMVEPMGAGAAASSAADPRTERVLGMTARGCLAPSEMMCQYHQIFAGCRRLGVYSASR